MVFKAHIPHKESKRKTWFGYWKDDGFVKTKHLGRIDQYVKWERIKNNWIEAYRNSDSVPGESVKHYVTENDEWCAEAYMETDYSKLTEIDFEKTVKNYLVFKLLNNSK